MHAICTAPLAPQWSFKVILEITAGACKKKKAQWNIHTVSLSTISIYGIAFDKLCILMI
jgi:hypothetical protein